MAAPENATPGADPVLATKQNAFDTRNGTPITAPVRNQAIAPLVKRVCTTHHWIKKPGEPPTHLNSALTDERVEQHLNGGYGAGACPIAPGSSTTRCAVLDMDSHKGEVSWTDMKEQARSIIKALAECELHAIPFRSSGGSGIHLIMLWQEEQDAYSVREALRIALAKCGLKSGTKGVAQGQVEVFPKQDAVPHDGFGSMFVLPLHAKSCALYMDGTLDDTVPGLIKWRASEPVTLREKPIPHASSVAVTADTAVIKSALAAIPNDDAEYDFWRNVGFAIHSATGGSHEGLDLFQEFSSRSSKYDPDETERAWSYMKDDRPNGITVRTLYAHAQRHGWQDPTLADAFEVLVTTAAPAPSTSGIRFVFAPVGEFASRVAPPFKIKGVLPDAALAVIFGESGSGKTFFALDMIGAIAQGIDWRGHRTQPGRVGYICAEGASGFRNRVKAYMRHNNLEDKDLDLFVLADAPNFMKVDDINDVIAAVMAKGPMSVIVVDTFAQVMPGANENAGEDVGKAIYHCRRLHAQTGAMVILIHHAGKDSSKGARGWSGLRAAADCEIEITRFEQDRLATITKLKDGEDGTEFGFMLKTQDIGFDEDCDPITSCVVEAVDAPKKVAKRDRPTPRAQGVLDAFDSLANVTVPPKPLADDDVIAAAIAGKPKHKNLLRDAKRDLKWLEDHGHLTRDGLGRLIRG